MSNQADHSQTNVYSNEYCQRNLSLSNGSTYEPVLPLCHGSMVNISISCIAVKVQFSLNFVDFLWENIFFLQKCSKNHKKSPKKIALVKIPSMLMCNAYKFKWNRQRHTIFFLCLNKFSTTFWHLLVELNEQKIGIPTECEWVSESEEKNMAEPEIK